MVVVATKQEMLLKNHGKLRNNLSRDVRYTATKKNHKEKDILTGRQRDRETRKDSWLTDSQTDR